MDQARQGRNECNFIYMYRAAGYISCLRVASAPERQSETDRQTDRQRLTERDRDRERQRQTDRQRQRTDKIKEKQVGIKFQIFRRLLTSVVYFLQLNVGKKKKKKNLKQNDCQRSKNKKKIQTQKGPKELLFIMTRKSPSSSHKTTPKQLLFKAQFTR